MESQDGFLSSLFNSSILRFFMPRTYAVTSLVGATDSAAGKAAHSTQTAGNVGGATEQTAPGRGVGNVFTYVTSPWAVLCLFMAVVLNRTTIYASLRRPLVLTPRTRFFVRLVPILLCLSHVYRLSLALRCQTSEIYLGEGSSRSAGGFLRQVAMVGNWWMDDLQACEAAGMVPDEAWAEQAYRWGGLSPPEAKVPDGGGGEAVSAEAPTTGGPEYQPVGKEEDLAPIRGSLELLWPFYKTVCLSQFVEVFVCAVTACHPSAETGMTLMEHSLAFAEAEFLATPRVFEILSASSGNDTTVIEPPKVIVRTEKNVSPEALYIAIISALGHLTSHILGIFNWQAKYRLINTGIWGVAFLSGFAWALVFGPRPGAVLQFPTVCVVGFIPHLLIFSGILVCGAIYSLALALTSLFPPPGVGQRVSQRPSLHAGIENLQANLTWGTVTINGSDDFYTTLLKLGFQCLTAASEATYLNEGRAVRLPAWTWLEEQRTNVLNSQRRLGLGGGTPPGLIGTGVGKGPYSLERKDVKGIMAPRKGRNRSGSSRWIGAGEMMRGVCVLLVGLTAGWVPRRFRTRDGSRSTTAEPIETDQGLRPGGEEDEPSGSLYTRFVGGIEGPLWGECDNSGDFVPDDSLDDDASTIISSASDVGSLADFPDDEQPSGSRTPTQARPHSSSVSPPPQSFSPFSEIFSSPADLASLLDPQTPEDRAQALALGRHLKAPGILTRSSYQATPSSSLESLIFQRRRRDPMGSYSSCVICQSSPRTILVWPCRCLALCEDCRVCLAHNNYKGCVCCRQPVEGFSRIYIP